NAYDAAVDNVKTEQGRYDNANSADAANTGSVLWAKEQLRLERAQYEYLRQQQDRAIMLGLGGGYLGLDLPLTHSYVTYF
ncbi:MAG: hypothetical protein ACOYOS_24370, partial [Syntrophales bacterium]